MLPARRRGGRDPRARRRASGRSLVGCRQAGNAARPRGSPRRASATSAASCSSAFAARSRRARTDAQSSRPGVLSRGSRCRDQRRRRVAVAEHADQIDDRAVRRLFASVMISSSGRRTPRPIARRASSAAGSRYIGGSRRLSSADEQLAACRRVLPGCQRFRQLGFELRQAAAQIRRARSPAVPPP